jgi:hypothetical protein
MYNQIKNVVPNDLASMMQEELLKSTAFPWYLMHKTLPNEDDLNDHPYLSHILMHRTQDNQPGEKGSMLYDTLMPVFQSVTDQLNMNVKHVMRANINLTWHHPQMHGAPHRDHQCDHYNMIIYLNKFTQGATYIFDDNNQILDCAPSLYRGATVFGGGKHAQGFCAPNELRLIAVFTFQTH